MQNETMMPPEHLTPSTWLVTKNPWQRRLSSLERPGARARGRAHSKRPLLGGEGHTWCRTPGQVTMTGPAARPYTGPYTVSHSEPHSGRSPREDNWCDPCSVSTSPEAEKNVPEKKCSWKKWMGHVYEQGLQDSRPGTEGRHLSKISNFYAGLFKEVWRVSPIPRLLHEPFFLPQFVRCL